MCHGDGVAALEAVEVVDEVADAAHLALPLVVSPARPETLRNEYAFPGTRWIWTSLATVAWLLPLDGISYVVKMILFKGLFVIPSDY